MAADLNVRVSPAMARLWMPSAVLAALFLVATFLNGESAYPAILGALGLVAAVVAFSDATLAAVLVVGTSALNSYGIITRSPQAITVYQLVLIAALLGTIWRALRGPRKRMAPLTSWDLGVLLLLIAAGLSIPFSDLPVRSLVGAIEIAFLVYLYFLISRVSIKAADRDAVILTVIVTGTYWAFIAIGQEFLDKPLVPLLERHVTGSSIAPLRVSGFFANPNTLAILLVLTLLLALERAVRGGTLRKTAPYLLSLALCSVAIRLTFSREAYIGVLVGGVALLFALLPRFRVAVAMLTVVALVVAAVFVGSVVSGFITARVLDTSAMTRVNLSIASAKLFAAHPLTGVGISAFRYPDPGLPTGVAEDPHQMPFGIPAEMGLLGLLAEVLMLGSLVYVSTKMRRLAADKTPVAPVAGAIAFFAMSFFNWFVFFESFWVALALVGGIFLVEGYAVLPLRRNARESPDAGHSAI